MNVSTLENSNFCLDTPETIKLNLVPEELTIQRTLPTHLEAIPQLSYGLERCLYNRGVHWLRDPRTNVYNFDPFLRYLPSPSRFNFDRIAPFRPASRDPQLMNMAADRGCTFVTSTSSISPSLALLYFVLSRLRPLNLDTLSQAFVDEPRTFTMLSRGPSAVLLQPHGEDHQVRSLVVEKPLENGETVLSRLGVLMERLLTENKPEFLKMLLPLNETNSRSINSNNKGFESESDLGFAYSQLDCHDARLPRQTFDLKTRAVLPVRMDLLNYDRYRDYRLVSNHGLYCSFEREYYDMCRSALLKYNFQVRIGDMDGIFVAYHNAHEIFGFQYISREEIDERLFGNSITGDAAFSLILQLYNTILTAIVPLYPRENVIRLTFSIDRSATRLIIFSEDLGLSTIEGVKNENEEEEKEAELMNTASLVGTNPRQFVLHIHSLVNGFREDEVVLNVRGGDRWNITGTLSQTSLNATEFDTIRARVRVGGVNGSTTRTEGEGSERGGMTEFLRIINENTLQRNVVEPRNVPMEEVIAPWTIV